MNRTHRAAAALSNVLGEFVRNAGRDVTAPLMHDPDGVEQLPAQRAFEQVARRGGLQCLKLLREVAGAVPHPLNIDRSFIVTTLDDPNTMLGL